MEKEKSLHAISSATGKIQAGLKQWTKGTLDITFVISKYKQTKGDFYAFYFKKTDTGQIYL